MRFDVDAGTSMPPCAVHEFGLRALVSHPPTLEELFLRHYGDELEAEGIGWRGQG